MKASAESDASRAAARRISRHNRRGDLQSPPYKRPSSLDASARARAVRAARPGLNVSKAAPFFFAAESARAFDDNYTLTRPLTPASLAARRRDPPAPRR